MRAISSVHSVLQKIQKVWPALRVYLRGGGGMLSVSPVLDAELTVATS